MPSSEQDRTGASSLERLSTGTSQLHALARAQPVKWEQVNSMREMLGKQKLKHSTCIHNQCSIRFDGKMRSPVRAAGERRPSYSYLKAPVAAPEATA